MIFRLYLINQLFLYKMDAKTLYRGNTLKYFKVLTRSYLIGMRKHLTERVDKIPESLAMRESVVHGFGG